ncbi:MAG TPA: IS3 family transposase [Pyrinomonadaceae bacterium]|nr:IS3 family transposase [Pyrinomonadaceae bacterium]
MATPAQKRQYLGDHRAEFGSIVQGLQIMRLASSSYYYEPLTDPEERDRNDAELRDHIERLQGEFPGYGYRRLGQQLRREGIVVNDKKIRRVQRKYQLFPIRWHSFKISTTDSNHGHKVYPNLLTGKTLTGINQAWVADITYIRILKGFVFLAAILDRYSRKLIGWAISKRIDAELGWAALKSALETRQPPPGCIHHSDRGVQYACREYIDLLEQANMQISMSRTANPYDNAHMESFFKTLKYEEVHLANYETYDDVIRRIPHFIEEVYNSKRLHSALGYLPPIEYEMAIQLTKTADRDSLNSR